MGKLFGAGSLFSTLGSVGGAVNAAVLAITILCIILLVKITNLQIFGLASRIYNRILAMTGRMINKQETKYHRDVMIGKVDERRRRVKIYRFLNDLTIDLGLKQRGATPYEFLMFVVIGSLLATIIMCQILFGSMLMVLIMYPIMFAGIMCILYTRANIAHDSRIEAVIEAENIISNNIKNGVVVAVRNSIHVLPREVSGSFKDFLDNVEHKNYHIKTALLELNQHLGTIADDFIKKCIVLETEEEHGIVGMFKDVVEINNSRMQMRTEMKRKFEEVVMEFLMGSTMIFMFLFGVLLIYPDVRNFYLGTLMGQLLISLDILLLIVEFVYITYLRAQEL